MEDKKPIDIPDLFKQHTPILEALQRAVKAARQQHKKAGNPVAEWHDGKVVWIPPEQIED